MTEIQTMKSILEGFCLDSGQTPNWSKSAILFSKNVDFQTRQAIKHVFPVEDLNKDTTHLGHPLLLPAKDRSSAYSFILDKFKSKLTCYKANKLSHAGRLTLINSVLLLSPSITCLIFFSPKNSLQVLPLSLGSFGGHVFKKGFNPNLFAYMLGQIFAGQRRKEDLE